MNWTDIAALWNRTPIKIMDIRHAVLQPGDKLRAYRLPANAFLVNNQGEALLALEGIDRLVSSSQVIHGCKGASLTIWCLNCPYDYYLILYKPVYEKTEESAAPWPGRRASFGGEYAFQLLYPLPLLTLLGRMHHYWELGDDLNKVEVTGLFYQFVYEHLHQLKQAGTKVEVPDLSAQIARYIYDHYNQPISMDTLAHLFHYSTRYLARVFKRKYGRSPLEYLLHLRINRAKTLLTQTDVPVSHIARSVGYTDMYYFNRLFKKLTGTTPVQFKMRSLNSGSIRTNFTPESSIVPQAGEGYINKENHYQQEAWRVDEMNRRFKRTFAATLLFSLSVLLAACGGAAQETQQNSQQTAAESKQENDAVQTRMYTDALGREVEIPVQPTKVVVITYGGYLLPLGMKPIGVDQTVLDQYPGEMSGVTSIGEGLGSVEAISALEPDLILLPDYHDAGAYANLEKIAPTVTVAWGGDADVVPILRAIGDIMNRKEEAEAWITQFEDKLGKIREQAQLHIEPGTTAISFILYKGEVLLGGEGGTLGKLIYNDLGFQMPQQFKSYADGGGVLSLEELVSQPADYFFTQMNEDEVAQMEELFKKPLYQSIPAVKEKRIINVPRTKWNFGPYLTEQAVDELYEKLNALFK